MKKEYKTSLKDMNEFRETTTDKYRESGFEFFNKSILQFAYDQSIPVLERINYVNIVLNNYMEHFGRSVSTLLPSGHFEMISRFNRISGMINRAFNSIDTSQLTHFHINLPELYETQESEKDQPVLIFNNHPEIKYVRKADKKNLVFDGINYVPLTFIRDFSVNYEIPEVGMWSEEYIDNRINEMESSKIPEVIVWINNNIPSQKKKALWEYILKQGLYPIFINVDLLNCVNYDANEEESDLKYQPIEQNRVHIDYLNKTNFCDIFRLPYDSFDNVIDLYDQAIHNEHVKAIYITIYRTKIDMRLMNTLIEGTHLGKKLNIYVELMARGDERNNFNLVKKLQTECDPNYLTIYTSFKGLKIHAKLGLIEMDNGRFICHCGTGNFNEVTARLYKDTHIITDDPKIVKDAIRSFLCIAKKNPKGRIKLKKILRKEIRKEIEKGSRGRIILKCNHIADSEINDMLSLAKKRGCEVKLMPRSTFGYSEKEFGEKNFRGGRFLEHERVYIFGRDEDTRVYLSSSDILFRNLYKRMEFTFKLPYYVDINQFIKECEES